MHFTSEESRCLGIKSPHRLRQSYKIVDTHPQFRVRHIRCTRILKNQVFLVSTLSRGEASNQAIMAESIPPAQLQYYEKHASDNMKPNLIAAAVLGLVIACIAVLLRFIARWKQRASVKADDWLILLALLPLAGFTIFLCFGVHYGEGRHIIFLENQKGFVQVYIGGVVVYALTVALIKVSILCLYHRIFASREMFIAAALLAALIIVYNTALVLVAFLQCIPLSKLWTRESGGKCISPQGAYVTLAIINVVTDFMILSLPIRSVIRLQMKWARKIQVFMAFGLGGIVTIFGIVRCFYVSQASSTDPTWTDARVRLWSQVEICVGIVSACLPVYRPLFRRRANSPHAGHLEYRGRVINRLPRSPLCDGSDESGGWSSVEVAKVINLDVERKPLERPANSEFFQRDATFADSSEHRGQDLQKQFTRISRSRVATG